MHDPYWIVFVIVLVAATAAVAYTPREKRKWKCNTCPETDPDQRYWDTGQCKTCYYRNRGWERRQ